MGTAPRRALTILAAALLLPLAGPAQAGAATQAGAAGGPRTEADPPPHIKVEIWPTPQQMTTRTPGFPLTPKVGLVRGDTADAAAERVVRETLERAGVQTVVTTDGTDPRTPVTIWLGGGEPVLDTLGVEGPAELPAEGYVLATGRTRDDRKHAVLAGVDPDGTYYAAQTLRQVIHPRPGRHWVPGVTVRDWPSMRYRGSIEGFYGTPWSHEDRLDHLDYLGAHKMNTYEYAPKDDPYHRERWRDPYPAEKLAELGELIDRARENHVDFTFALSPGLSICYSAPADLAALLAKFEAIYELGGRAFNVPLDDIDYNQWHCAEDPERFGTGGAGAGRAQAYLLNQVQEWIESKGDVAPLQMVPTEYYNTTETPYKKALREEMDADIVVHWTGIGVVPPAITTTQAAAAREVFGHDVLVWDNYPVNDYIAGRLPLGDYAGREPGLSEHLAGIISNPANQAAASKISLFSFADFSWHDETFDTTKAWLAALSELAGGDSATVAALRTFADVTTYDGTLHKTQAPVLRERLEAFWRSWEAGDTDEAVAGLRPHLVALAQAPEVIRAGAADPRFVPEAAAWLDATELWARAGLAAVDMLAAQASGDGSAAWRHRQEIQPLVAQATAIRDTRAPHRNTHPQIADGVLDVFLTKTQAANDRWLGLTGSRFSPMTTLGTYQDNVPARMIDGDPTTFYWANEAPKAGDHVGVDLGAVREIGDVAVLMTKPGSPNDYIREGVLEYSVDGQTWETLTTGSTPEVRATAPEGSKARYVRYRATADNGSYWLVVREFTVQVLDGDGPVYSVAGTPAPAGGSTLAGAADGLSDTWYHASTAPAEGDALVVTASQARPLDRVVVLSTPDTQATVQVRDTDGTWQAIGSLADGYTELTAPGIGSVDAVRLAWEPGSPAPGIAEVIFRYADVPPADLAFDPAEVSVEKGGSATVAVRLGSTRTTDVTGTLTIGPAPGVEAEPASTEVTVPRGADRVVEVRISAADDAARGARELPVRFETSDGREASGVLTVHLWPATSDTNVALGRPVTASGVEPTTEYVPENAVDGDPDTRWASGYDDASWLTVDLGTPTRLGRAVLRWEAAYGKAYRLEVSDDNVTWRTAATVDDSAGGVDELRLDAEGRYVRFQGVQRATQWGYSLWELELYPVK